MLRRKLLLVLGPLVLLLIATAAGAIWLLEDVLQDIRHIDSAWGIVEQVNDLSITVNSIEVDLHELRTGVQKDLDGLIERVERAQDLMDVIGRHEWAGQARFAAPLLRIRQRMPDFVQQASALATAQDDAMKGRRLDGALDAAVELRRQTLPLSQYVRQTARDEQDSLAARFRWLVLGLSLAFLLEINIAVMVLMRAAGMVLHPMERLLAGSRALTRGEFDHRVRICANDEFHELADAFNALAGQLQANEQRRMEMLGQIALMLNHELNNAMAIIEMKVEPLVRQFSGNPLLHNCCEQIRQNLARMARTVESLKHVRRIVLTDYVAGMKMLDLERSVRGEEPEAPPAAAPAPGGEEQAEAGAAGPAQRELGDG